MNVINVTILFMIWELNKYVGTYVKYEYGTE